MYRIYYVENKGTQTRLSLTKPEITDVVEVMFYQVSLEELEEAVESALKDSSGCKKALLYFLGIKVSCRQACHRVSFMGNDT